MAITYKVLGQVNPTGISNTDLYTVPAESQAIVSTFTVSNISANPATFRVFLRVAGAATSNSNTLIFDSTSAPNTINAFTLGITLAATDVITVRSSVGNALSFQLFGSEITA